MSEVVKESHCSNPTSLCACLRVCLPACLAVVSRFYARPLAELITSQGRDILQSTVDLVNDLGVPGLEVTGQGLMHSLLLVGACYLPTICTTLSLDVSCTAAIWLWLKECMTRSVSQKPNRCRSGQPGGNKPIQSMKIGWLCAVCAGCVLCVQVIYGDTDSIMIHTNSNDYEAAEALGAKVKAAVNRWGGGRGVMERSWLD